MRFGYTTGSSATAAAKAAAIGLWKGNIPDEVEIDTPAGVKLKLKVYHKQSTAESSECAVQKDAGDDPDVTNGCMVYARVERTVSVAIEIDGGEGVGRVTKPGLQILVGQAAINPVPRRMIENAVREVIGKDDGAKVIISVPNGNTLAEKTFNPKLGIMGGISIIGTTGIVRPMSEDAFKTSLLCGLDIARGMGYEAVALVPGSLGERAILNLVNIPKDQIVQMSNFVGFMLDAVRERHFKKVILAGHPGKLIKLLRGDFHTHSAVSRPANDILIDIIKLKICNQSHFKKEGKGNGKKLTNKKEFLPDNTSTENGLLPSKILSRINEVSTVEGIVELLRDYQCLSIMNEVAEKIEDKVRVFCRGEQMFTSIEVGVILFDMKGAVLGISDSAQSWLNHTKTR
ncbi:MAG: cobalt-precorrin-5B (C(1))-methyltransferase CbiD [Candidatus Brocadia sp.]|nr:cobalt-precorrin-5B (C(1))-methyltransferase CbiD [Candidatus Brocadia sp.]